MLKSLWKLQGFFFPPKFYFLSQRAWDRAGGPAGQGIPGRACDLGSRPETSSLPTPYGPHTLGLFAHWPAALFL